MVSESEFAPDETLDEFMGGRLRVIQSRSGYRFSSDAVLLAEFVSIRAGDLVVDLGTGCGVIPLVLLLNRSVRHAVGLEIQPELARQALRNARLNRLEHRMSVIQGDLRSLPLVQFSADVVICNPPYRQVSAGRVNPDPQRAIARHEVLASLDDILRAARSLLREGGRFGVIHAAVRLVDLLIRMRGFGLEPKNIQFIHPGPGKDAKLVLVEACAGGRRGVKILPPLADQGRTSL